MNISKNTLFIFSVLFLIICTFNATAKNKLPGNIMVEFSTGNVNETIHNIETFAIKAIKGTPQAQMIRPGMLGMVIKMGLTLPRGLGMIDFTKQMHLIISFAKERNALIFTALLPTPDLKEQIKKAQDSGIKITKDEHNILKISHQKSLTGYLFFKEINNNYFAFSESTENLAEIANVYSKGLPKIKAGNDFKLVVDIQKALTSKKKNIETNIANITKMFTRKSNETITKIIPLFLKEILKLVENNIVTFEATAKINEQGLIIKEVIVAQENSSLHVIAQSYQNLKSDSTLLKYLPRETSFGIQVNYSQKAMQIFSNLSEKWFKIISENSSDETWTKFNKHFTQSLFSINGPSVSSFFFDTELNEKTVTYLSIKDSDAHLKIVGESFKNVDQLVNAFYEKTNLPLSVQATITNGSILGNQYKKIKMNLILKEQNKLSKLKKETYKRSLKNQLNQTQTYISTKPFFTVVGGKNISQQDLENAVNNITKRTQSFTKKSFFTRFDAETEKQIFFSGAYLNDFIKFGFIQALKESKKEIPSTIEIAKKIPESIYPITVSNGINKHGNISLTWNAPIQAINETVLALFNAVVEYQQNKK